MNRWVSGRESAGLFLAVSLFAAALWWPLVSQSGLDTASLEAVEGVANQDQLLPPPSWLLPLDDAYIFIRFAQQIARGRLYQWTDDQISTGSTSTIFPWLLLPGQWLFDDLAGWSRWSSAIGVLTTWFLSLVATCLMSLAGLPRPWPLVTGLALIFSGPIAWVSLAGMDSAFGAGVLLSACFSYSRLSIASSAEDLGERRAVRSLLTLLAFLPLIRPDFLPIVACAGALFWRRPMLDTPRWCLLLMFVPTLFWVGFNLATTGFVSPAGVLAKSNFSSPFLSLEGGLSLVWITLTKGIVPLYLGFEADILPLPIGPLAVLTATATACTRWIRFSDQSGRILRVLRPVAAVWFASCITSSMSGYLVWQFHRHHHPGIACAWILAFGGLWVVCKEIGFRFGASLPHIRAGLWRALILSLPFLLLIRLSSWSFTYFKTAVFFYQDNGAVGEWLEDHLRDEVILVHDAGLLAIAHDGPAIDAIGLGTPSLALPFRDGEGAVVESLARLPLFPAFAAGRSRLLQVPSLVGHTLFLAPSSHYSDEPMAVTALRSELLENTELLPTPVDGIDFAHLPSERRHHLEWSPAPHQPSSFAHIRAGASGAPEIQGCRALHGSVEIQLPKSISTATLKWSTQAGPIGRLRIASKLPNPRETAPWEVELTLESTSDAWSESTFEIPSGTSAIELKNTGDNLLCLESLGFR